MVMWRKMKKKYNMKECPQNDTWFANGGRCGWAKVCKQCTDNPKKQQHREK